ncbi:MAG: phosphate regulon sensor histidine kinase PhoR [Aquabacterium sp.]
MDTSNSWLLSRVGSRLLAVCLGGGAGWWLGQFVGHPISGAVSTAALTVMGLSVFDTLKGDQLLDWLLSPEGSPPNLPGIWGEVAHRVHRIIRARETKIETERDRLAQFLQAIEASPVGVLLLDSTDHITWISPAGADHFGLDRKRDLEQRVTNLVRQPAFVQYLQGGDYRQAVQFQIGRAEHSCLSVQVRVYGEGQKLVLSQDVTERERADNMRRTFVANVSHEIRTPLTVLSGFIETMSAIQLTEVEQKRVITLMAQQADRMQTLVADLLTLATIEGSPRPASDKWLKVGDLMKRLENDARGLSRDRHQLEFTIDPHARSMAIAAAESEWHSAMGNLISNAIRYTPDGGKIAVKWTLLDDGCAAFSVTDSGIGIEAEHLPRLTERFYRVDGSRSRETGGTGLGLSIVKHVVQRHGGDLKVASEPGKGSTFTLTLPSIRVRNS